ncbi:carbamoyltransferase family protein [Pseudonocardia cypriaca]|uniref:Carbamoyltransferase n=1 Tax=Pseudonocardia cypriaca TaxID=882449 RepID=A0A543FX96_9PSEU|nr:carbamoyltransferase C-terminal domain-containing protein [Pseudonocardia cypriaca]TQM38462.1 carbamoyltransferase [Pseudonocardia cypriaca]
MDSEPVVVGINRTQDGSVAVARGRSTVYSLQKERLTRRKHHWGRLGDLPNLYLPRMAALREPVDLVVECFSSDDEIKHVDVYHQEVLDTLRFRGEPRIVTMSHHLSHLYSAFPPSPFRAAAGMVIDGQGSPVRDFTESTPGIDEETPPDLLEVSSFYRCERGRPPGCFAKQLWDGDWDRPAGLGCFYYLLTRVMFTGEGSEGKVMGLAPFGNPQAFGLPDLVVDGHRVLIPREWLDVLADRDRFSHFLGGPGSFTDCADLAAEGQRAFETALLEVTAWLHEQTGAQNLAFAGGTALNCSANGRILRESAFDDVFIPPSAHDGGTALGCALYGLMECLGEPSEFRWTDDFLGPDPEPSAVAAAVRAVADDPALVVEQPADLATAAAELLDHGYVVAVHQGRSESGPRALGDRSIIGDARHPAMRDFVNFRVKGREWFRPLAPLVLADAAPTIFDVDRPTPFMQLAIDVRPEHRDALPAITHVDGTARIQTVESSNTPFLHALLTAFRDRTGCPVLINTSLNGKGDPLTETPEDSIACLTGTQMHALVMPPFLIRKPGATPVPRDWTP